MERRRIHNNITIDWYINRGDHPVVLDGCDINVRLVHIFGESEKISWTAEGNKVHIVFFGKDQTRVGKYQLICTINEGTAKMAEVDHCDAVELVAHSHEEGGDTFQDDEPIVIHSDISVAKEGPSAYDIAVANGFVGTEVEWLESLKGKSLYDLMVEQGKFVGTPEEFTAVYEKAVNDAQRAADDSRKQFTILDKAMKDFSAAEKNRTEEEAKRVAAEKIRQTETQSAIDNADAATERANAAASQAETIAQGVDKRLTEIENGIGVAESKINKILEG